MAVGPGAYGRSFQSPAAPCRRPEQTTEQAVFVAPPLRSPEQFRDDQLIEQELAVEVTGPVRTALPQPKPSLGADQSVVGTALEVLCGAQAGEGQEVMRFESPFTRGGVPDHRAPQSARDARSEVEFQAVRHEHAPQVAAQWANRRDPRSRIARGPRPAIDVDGRLKGFDAVAITQPSPAVQPNFHERCRRVVSTPKQGAAAKSVVQGVAAGLQGYRGRGLPLRTSAPAGGQSAFAVQAIECTVGPTVEPRSCTPEDLVAGLHRPRGLMGPERGRCGQGQRGERVRAGFRLNPIHANLAQ